MYFSIFLQAMMLLHNLNMLDYRVIILNDNLCKRGGSCSLVLTLIILKSYMRKTTLYLTGCKTWKYFEYKYNELLQNRKQVSKSSFTNIFPIITRDLFTWTNHLYQTLALNNSTYFSVHFCTFEKLFIKKLKLLG